MTITFPGEGVKISVIMVAYNVGAYIDEAIQSVLSQRGVTFELLIGCDPSGDGTWSRIENYLIDPRVRAWHFRRCRWIGAVRNDLIARSRGKYLSICDPDDLMLPGNLKTLVEVLERRPDVGVVSSDVLVLDERRKPRLKKEVELLGPEDGWDLVTGIIGFRHGSLMRRDLVVGAGGYRKDIPLAEDHDLLLKLAERARFVALRTRPLYCWRRHASSVTHTATSSIKKWCHRKIFRDAILRRYGVRVSW